MTASRFTFRNQEWREIGPSAWVDWWAARYDVSGKGYNEVYFDLIAKPGKLSGEDFELVGKWKESCLSSGNRRWKTGTPAGYDVWMQAKAELPECPENAGVAKFLAEWPERKFAAGKDQRKRFGLSRATTLLHFVSGGQYPILDSRVEKAMSRLGSPIDEIKNKVTVEGYLKSFYPQFSELAAVCGLSGKEGLRKLDNALFEYGAKMSSPS